MKGFNKISWSPYIFVFGMGIPYPFNLSCMNGCVLGGTVTCTVFPLMVVNSKLHPPTKSNTEMLCEAYKS